MNAYSPLRKLAMALAAFAYCIAPSTGYAQMEVWHIGKGGLSWSSQAETQIGALDVDGALQPLELAEGESLIDLLRSSGQRFLNGQPVDYTQGGQPRTWSNDGFFNQLNGPLDLVDGDPATSSKSVFKSAQSQAGAAFFWDLGAPFPINRIRFYPDPNDPDAFIKAFELEVNDGETFNNINRPEYELLRRVEVNRQQVVDIQFAPLQGRFLHLRVLSKTTFNLAEFEIYGQGFVPIASYESSLHSFGSAVNYGLLRVHTTRLGDAQNGNKQAPSATIQMRTGADDSPLSYFRRDRNTGSQEEVSFTEYNSDLPRRALYRQDPTTGALLEELDRAPYLDLPIDEQGPVRDFIKGDIRADVENWSAWSPGIEISSTGLLEIPIDLPSPRQYMQFRVFFNGDAENAIRIDTLQVEFSPSLVSTAIGEIALASNLQPANGVLEVASGVDTTFVYDIQTAFTNNGQAGYRGIRVEAFPAPTFLDLQTGNPLTSVADVNVISRERGFDVLFPPVSSDNNQPLRVLFDMRLLEHNTPINAWLLGDDDVPPHPISPGNASEAISTGVMNAFATQSQPDIQVDLSTTVLTPNGDGINDVAQIDLILSQFAASMDVTIDICDLSGRSVHRLTSAQRSSGSYSDIWNGRDEYGNALPPGLYIVRVAIDGDFKQFENVRLLGVAY